MIVRCRLHLVIGITCLLLTVSGCSDRFLAGPLHYDESEALTKDLKGKSNLAGKTRLQDKVRKALVKLYGEDPKKITVPEGMGALLTGGGARLANYQLVGEGVNAKIKRNVSADKRQIAGGFGLYRRHCLHCHGVSGPATARRSAFLYPDPARLSQGAVQVHLHAQRCPAPSRRPAADDQERPARHVDAGVRGADDRRRDRAGHRLRDLPEHARRDRAVPDRRRDDLRRERPGSPLGGHRPGEWRRASSTSGRRPSRRWSIRRSPRTPSSRESILRGRDLFLGKTKEKLECAGCHGSQGLGDGPSFVSQDVFNQVVFGGNPSERDDRIKALDDKTKELWVQKLDDWGNPLRPANLNRGVYKGGRRPLDIYWRIAKGITGAQMPAHYPTINDETDLGPGQLRAGLALSSPSCSRMPLPPCPSGRRRWPTASLIEPIVPGVFREIRRW